MSFFTKIKNALSKTSSKIITGLYSIVAKKCLDDDALNQIEELLIAGDLGSKSSKLIKELIRKKRFKKDASIEDIKEDIQEALLAIITPFQKKLELENGLNVFIISGINGNGKTTSIAKLSRYFSDKGLKVAMSACDTFRSAAKEQLEIWSERTGADFYSFESKDPASIAYKSTEKALDNKIDVLLIDTAGRLHNYSSLMDEFAKIVRVTKKKCENTRVIQVIDATTGQNAISQVDTFQKSSEISGLIITKIDGTAKAGVLVPITEQFKIPTFFLGVGEKTEDLIEFDAKDFTTALISDS